MLTLYLFSILLIFAGSVCSSVEECNPDAATCEYWLVIEDILTMRYKNYPVYAHEGKLYKYDEHWSNYSTIIPISEVITLDGVPRMVTTVNKTIPGPPIIVYENQQIIIHVQNKLLSESASIHWHGLHQRGTPWMDGVPYITMCPIIAGQTFTFKFKAQPKGTFWYHSSIAAQRSNGLFGPFIIKEKPTQNISSPPKDIIMTVGDWHHHQSNEVYMKYLYGDYTNNKMYEPTHTHDGGKFYDHVPWVSALINGKGRYSDPISGKQIKAPLSQFDVVKGEKYRFRVIAAGAIYPLRISVDNHNLTLVASDGHDLKEKIVESIIINPGERFDFLLDANQPIGNYWVRAMSIEVNVERHTVEAILHYDGTNVTEPTTTRKQCIVKDPCYVVNCPFLYYPKGTNTFCLTFDDLEAKVDDAPPTYNNRTSQEHFLNFAFPGIPGVTTGTSSINGRQFEFDYNFPGVKSDHDVYDCNRGKHSCGFDKICRCNYKLALKYNETIQMIWSVMGTGKGSHHPIHLHGHTFYVLKMGHSVYNQTTAEIVDQNQDINCGGGENFCNQPSWANNAWINGNIPGLNLKNPPRKDTIIIPSGGYVVIRIRSNNPGKWFLHCHVGVHRLDGMAMLIDEAADKQPNRPKGFPVCQNFDNAKPDQSETKCQKQRKHALIEQGQRMDGVFIPQCERDGSYTKKQCYGSTGYCWNVNKRGKRMISGTEGSLICSKEKESTAKFIVPLIIAVIFGFVILVLVILMVKMGKRRVGKELEAIPTLNKPLGQLNENML